MARQVLPEPERRWLRALLVLGTLAVALFLLGLVANVVLYFSDILVILGLAWLLAFMVSPVVDVITRSIPSLPRTSVVVAVYILLFVLIVVVLGLIAGTLATAISNFANALPGFQSQLPGMLEPWQDQLTSLGIQVDVQNIAQSAVETLGTFAATAATSLTGLAFSTLSIFGNVVIVVFLSLFIVVDKGRMVAFLNRLVPPRWSDEANLFQQSVSIAFGGFLRGQATLGIIYGLIAAAGSAILGIDYLPVTSVAVAGLQMIPFFGPFISWAPPVLAAMVSNPTAVLPIFVIMWVGWFIVMNVLQPRLMAATVGIHPVVVLVSVLIGLKLQGFIGAIFAIPVASVISTFFFYYLQRSSVGNRDVTTRAAQRVGERQGHPVRIPKPPDVTEAADAMPSLASDAGVEERREGDDAGLGKAAVSPQA
jgi:predicted PurR-regulated permease PerM